MLCSLRSFPEFVEPLLEAGADPDITGRDGRTPLTLACATNTAMVKLLIEHGANVNKRNGSHETPLAISVRLGKYMLPLSWYSVKYMLLKLVYSHILHAAIADISKNFLTIFIKPYVPLGPNFFCGISGWRYKNSYFSKNPLSDLVAVATKRFHRHIGVVLEYNFLPSSSNK